MTITVTVAVLTFRRPHELARLLPVVLAQAASLHPAAAVVVVDNDPAGGAAAVVAAHPPARYRHEPRPGIAAARNAALDAAGAASTMGTAGAVVFVDDDEVPQPGWLAALVGCWAASGADAVTGPVEAAFDRPPSAWVGGSGRFDRQRADTGSPRRGAATNNLLLDLAALRRLGLRFDESLGLTGGEDTVLTHRLVEAGGRIVWCDEAVVVEHVPPARATRSWVLRREYRTGTSWARMRLSGTATAAGRLRVRGDLAMRALARILLGSGRCVWGTVRRDPAREARGACLAAANAGLLAGCLGARYGEYRR